jgi:hypothetical protein
MKKCMQESSGLHFLVSELNESTNELDPQLVGTKIHRGTSSEADTLKNITDIYFRATRCNEGKIQMAQKRPNKESAVLSLQIQNPQYCLQIQNSQYCL